MHRLLLLVLLSRVVLICGAAERILYEQDSPAIVFRGIALSPEAFDEQTAIKRSRQFLIENSKKKLIVLTLVPDEHDATLGPIGCDHCEAYRFWRRQYDEVVKLKYPVGELLAIGKDAVLRYRDQVGRVSTTVLSGSDPRPRSLDRFRGKIVHISMQGLMPNPWLTLYVVGAGSIGSAAGAKYIAEFAGRVGVNDSTIQFRSDPWFINEIWRTWFPLFEGDRGDPPTETEFSRTKTPKCDVVRTVQGRITNQCSWEGTEVLR